MKRRGKTGILIGAVVLIGLAAAFVRTRDTAEYCVLLGTPSQKSALCRAIPSLSARRQQWCIERLLHNDNEIVRLAAIATTATCPDPTAVDPILLDMLRSDLTSWDIRTKSGQILLGRTPVAPDVITYLADRVDTIHFREHSAPLTIAFRSWQLQRMDQSGKQQLIHDACGTDAVAAGLRNLIRDGIDLFADVSDSFVEAAARDQTPDVQAFLASCRRLLGVTETEPPVVETTAPLYPLVEAEWLSDIQPSYYITDHRGVRCLALPDGGGGNMGHRRGLNGSVDIGTARGRLYAPHDGSYEGWAHVFFTDKCGNSFDLQVNGISYGHSKSSMTDQFAAWHWVPLKRTKNKGGWSGRLIQLTRGFVPLRLEAREDGVFIDKFVFLPQGEHPARTLQKIGFRWDPALSRSISFEIPKHSQSRGRQQDISVWVRRSSPDERSGLLALTVPPPFALVGTATRDLIFADDVPLASAHFTIALPTDAIGGEQVISARFTNPQGAATEAHFIIGINYPWLCTGPLALNSATARRLAGQTLLPPELLKEDFTPFPDKGIGIYRQLDMESAYGQFRGKILYLATDITVEADGDYLALLTADDTADVFCDGRPLISKPNATTAEGYMVMQTVALAKGQHQLVACVRQGNERDTIGPYALRTTPNHCLFKLLLRASRHTPTPHIISAPRVDEAVRSL